MCKFMMSENVDVIVVGFGAAGACAALEAAENPECRVLLLERFDDSIGGASGRCGGVIYAGGGTSYQEAVGISDSPEQMFDYLSLETLDAVQPETLERFCNNSVDNISWIEKHGVTFPQPPKMYPLSTSSPPDWATIYPSGNEKYHPFCRETRPAPRGHVVVGPSSLGSRPQLFSFLRKAVLSHSNIKVLSHTRVKKLLQEDGRVVGVEVTTIPKQTPVGFRRTIHNIFSYLVTNGAPASPFFGSMLKACLDTVENVFAKTQIFMASGGVILSSGGFSYNRDMAQKYLSSHLLRCPPLGTAGDMGEGIQMGIQVGGYVRNMEKASISKFLVPPYEFLRSLLVGTNGVRICNECYYPSRVAQCILSQTEDCTGYFIYDSSVRDAVRKALKDKKNKKNIVPFQKYFAFLNLFINSVKGNSLEKIAAKCGIEKDVFLQSIEEYNEAATKSQALIEEKGLDVVLKDENSRHPVDPVHGKSVEYLVPLVNPPFYALKWDISSLLWVGPYFTLGGLVVDEETGELIRESRSERKTRRRKKKNNVIPGVYAAGRTACGVPANGYVSGLSIADCIFSGRRAGRHAADSSVKQKQS